MIGADTNLMAYLTIQSPYTEAAERLLVKDREWLPGETQEVALSMPGWGVAVGG